MEDRGQNLKTYGGANHNLIIPLPLTYILKFEYLFVFLQAAL